MMERAIKWVCKLTLYTIHGDYWIVSVISPFAFVLDLLIHLIVMDMCNELAVADHITCAYWQSDCAKWIVHLYYHKRNIISLTDEIA